MKRLLFLIPILISCSQQVAPTKPIDLNQYNPIAVDLVQTGVDQADIEKNYYAAMLSFTKAIEIDPTFAEAYLGRALTKIKLNQIDSALPDLDRATELGNYTAAKIATKIRRNRFMQQLMINL